MNIKQLWKRFIGEDGRDAQETEILPSIIEVTETQP